MTKSTKNDLRKKLLGNSSIDAAAMLMDSEVFHKDMIHMDIPILNAAHSADFDGGFLSGGLTLIAGKSKHFKSGLVLLHARAFLKKHPNGMVLFYDSEFGTPETYFNNLDVSVDAIIHCPIPNLEVLKLDVAQQLENIERGDEVMIIVDSVGNLASKKEAEDAINNKSKQDMSREKQLKSFFRIITPLLNLKNVPMVCVMHTYETMDLFPQTVVSGGQGAYLSADTIWIIGRQKEQEASSATKKDLVGYNFIINVEKSRMVKEKSKFPLEIRFDDGINKYSGIFELAEMAGFVTSPTKGKYTIVNPNTGEVYASDVKKRDIEDEVFDKLLADIDLQKWLRSEYLLEMNKTDEEKNEESTPKEVKKLKKAK